jgi:hypothetical protein
MELCVRPTGLASSTSLSDFSGAVGAGADGFEALAPGLLKNELRSSISTTKGKVARDRPLHELNP